MVTVSRIPAQRTTVKRPQPAETRRRIERALEFGRRSHTDITLIPIHSDDAGKTWRHVDGTPVHFVHLRDERIPCDVDAQAAIAYEHYLSARRSVGDEDCEHRLQRLQITPRDLVGADLYDAARVLAYFGSIPPEDELTCSDCGTTILGDTDAEKITNFATHRQHCSESAVVV